MFDYISAAFNLSFQQTFFFFFVQLPSILLKRKMKSHCSLSYWPVIKLLKQLESKMLSLTFDTESNLICNSSGKTEFTFATRAVSGIFKHAYHVMKYL